MLMMRMTGRLNKTSPPMIIKRWAFLPFYQVKNLRCRSSAWIDGCPLSSNVWIFVVKLFKSVNFDYLPIIMNSLNFGAHYITGFSFWDRLHNFLHKFTWIVLSVHKLNKLGKFMYNNNSNNNILLLFKALFQTYWRTEIH